MLRSKLILFRLEIFYKELECHNVQLAHVSTEINVPF
jgi:hypothetical protein